MDATDTGVGDYGDLDRHGNYELRRVLNEERCRQFRRHLFLLSLRQIFKAYSIDNSSTAQKISVTLYSVIMSLFFCLTL